MSDASEQQRRYRQELGRQLRIRRGERARIQVLATFPRGVTVSTATYSSWELGTRNMPLTKLAILADALGTTPHEVLADVDRVMCAGALPQVLAVDLTALADVSKPEISSVSRWARAGVHGGQRVARLTPGDVTNLAELVGIPVEMLKATLAATLVSAA